MTDPKQNAASLIIYTDGGSRNNPGPAALGYVIFDHQGRQIEARGQFLGETTNNVAEYRAMIAAAERAVQIHAPDVTFRVDSQLLQRQITRRYRVRSPHLKPLFDRLTDILKHLPKWRIEHIPREQNRTADHMVNLAIDARGDIA